MDHIVIGMRGDTPFQEIIAFYTSHGYDIVLLNPECVMGKDHLESAVMHAERAMRNGTNRSKSLISEIILYSAWERQINKAIEKMRSPADSREYAAIILNTDDCMMDSISMERDDSILEPTHEKAMKLGLDDPFLDYVSQAVERVADVDLLKI